MNYLDDSFIDSQNDEYGSDEFWFWSDFQDLGMGIPEPGRNKRCQELEN